MQDAAILLAERYELGEVLGEGGMARVHLATDRTLDRRVAVKVLAPPYDRDRGYVERFRREALAAASLNHPNIVTVFDSGEDAGMQFIVMELVEGETLGARLRRTGPMDAEEVVEVGSRIASALAEAHTRGVVHRDVKPGNVMLADDGRVKVLDFGIARASGAEAVTRTGLVMGSASYLSPEQAQGSSADERSDVYALGCVLYQMVAGRPPFIADDPVAALYQHVNEPVPPPSTLRVVPPVLEAVIMRCLEKDPAARFASAAELEAALRSLRIVAPTATDTDVLPLVADTVVLDGRAASGRTAAHAVTTSAPRAPSDRRRRGFAIAAAVVAGLVLLGALAVWANPFDGDADRAAREGRREAAGSTDREGTQGDRADITAVTDDPAVGEPYAGLLAAIRLGKTEGTVTTDAAAALGDRAEALVFAYDAGDASAIDDAMVAFGEELSRRLGTSEVSPEDAVSIRASLDELVHAIVANLPEATAVTGATADPAISDEVSETDGEDDDDEDGDGGSDPPSHSNAGGNGKGNGHDDDD